MIVTALLEQPCNKSDNINKVVTSCQQLVPNLLTTCNKPREHNLLTACLQLATSCEIFTCVLKGTLTKTCAQKLVKILCVENVLQAFKVSKKFVYAEAKRESFKNWIFRRFPIPNTISVRDYHLILCILRFLH